MSEVLVPRNYPGMNDRSMREFYRWMVAVSEAVGISPPQSLTELSEQSLVPVLSRIHQLNNEVENLKKTVRSQKQQIISALNRIEDIERSI